MCQTIVTGLVGLVAWLALQTAIGAGARLFFVSLPAVGAAHV